MAWNTWLCDTITGENRFRIPVSGATWGRLLNKVSGGTTEIQLFDKGSSLITRASTLPLAKTFVLDWDGYVVYAGPIWSRNYVFGTGVLTLTHRDIWSMFAKRLLVTTNTKGVEKTSLRIPAVGEPTVSKKTLLKGIVFEGTDAESSMYRLPIYYPDDTAGPNARTYPGYGLTLVGDALQDVLDADSSVDVDFQPSWNSNGFLRYTMRAGNLNDSKIQWNAAAAMTGAFGLTWDDDAARVANNVIAVGEGAGEDMKIGAARNELSPFPAMENVISFKKETNVARLDELAAEHLRVFGAPTEQWGMSMMAGGKPGVKDLKLGGTASLLFSKDRWNPDGQINNRIIGFNGDLTQTVKLAFQPIGA